MSGGCQLRALYGPGTPTGQPPYKAFGRLRIRYGCVGGQCIAYSARIALIMYAVVLRASAVHGREDALGSNEARPGR